jgi:tetratricopeptide (TPR) repeat protein
MTTKTGLIFRSALDRNFTTSRSIAPMIKITPLLDYRTEMVVAYRHYLDKNYSLALATYRRVLTHYPANATALSGEAWSLYYLGDEDSAAVDFRRLLHANADDCWARKGLALCERRDGE